MSSGEEIIADILFHLLLGILLEEFTDGTETAADAACAVGCDKAQIVKSLVFLADGRTLLALLPGDSRADAAKVAGAVGAADARVAQRDEVVAATGFEPGAVAPFPAPNVSRVLIDRELLKHDVVWIGAGSPRHVAGLSPLDLARLSEAEVADLAEG